MTTAVKERPILFSGPMVRAILDGRKTVTRRVIDYCDSDKKFKLINGRIWVALEAGQYDPHTKKTIFGGECRLEDDCLYYSPIVIGKGPNGEGNPATCPYGSPGDRLWVRESFAVVDYPPIRGREEVQSAILYRADGGLHCWKPSIHMPRWASRITLEIKSISVERLQDITEEDAVREGAQCAGFPAAMTDRGAFAKLWEQINGPGSWAANPWVWRIEFEGVAISAK